MLFFGEKNKAKTEPFTEQEQATVMEPVVSSELPKQAEPLTGVPATTQNVNFKAMQNAGKKENKTMDYEVIISKNTAINGNINVNGGTRIDGYIEGTVVVNSNLFVGETGNLKANVYVENATVAGKITGEVSCKGRLEILATAKIYGTIKYNSLTVSEGAEIVGTMAKLDANGANEALPSAAAATIAQTAVAETAVVESTEENYAGTY